ncbi:MAG: GNAT family N-acetyltransferase [Dysgonamonadaceae bacterium]|jgi:predicted TIM-barrel fold metal-dependent hydrolase/GNAT superfamily N-acetyltransferase|nr:GNAT family N-acetyltransferase [Dysgonamonadaceae bacterium]
MEIIDAHVHLGTIAHKKSKSGGFPFDLYNDYKSFLKRMDASRVSRAVVLPIPHRDYDSRLSNEYLLEADRKSSNRLIPFCRIDDNLEENLCNGFKGAKLHLAYEDLEKKDLKCKVKLLEEYGVPLLLHAKFKYKVRQIEEILKYAPNLYLILAHMGRGHINTDEGIVENAAALKKYDRVYFETSTIEDPVTGHGSASINKVCDIIGNNRILFGTDYPFEKNKYDYQSRIDTFINGIHGKKALPFIMYNNIFELLNLGNDQERIVIREVKKSDATFLGTFLESLSEEDRKFLALSPKLSHIKTVIRSEKHCYAALVNNIIVGFMRESGRPEGYSLLEEIAVNPGCRRKGIARELLKHYHRIFSKTLAKTNAKNTGMIALLKRNGYEPENPDAQRIINWKRNTEQERQ